MTLRCNRRSLPHPPDAVPPAPAARYYALRAQKGVTPFGVTKALRPSDAVSLCLRHRTASPLRGDKKERPRGRSFYDRDYKPGSVIDSHLSSRAVANAVKPPSRRQPGKPSLLCGVAPDRVYSNGHFHAPLGELLPRLSTLTDGRRPSAVYLCCTFPQIALGGRYPLSLPCGARTFLMHGLSALCPRLSVPVA